MPFSSELFPTYLFFKVKADDEVQRSVSSVYDLISSILNEWAKSLVSAEALSDQLSF